MNNEWKKERKNYLLRTNKRKKLATEQASELVIKSVSQSVSQSVSLTVGLWVRPMVGESESYSLPSSFSLTHDFSVGRSTDWSNNRSIIGWTVVPTDEWQMDE